MTYKEIKKNEEVLAYLKKGNDNLGTMGFTDHSEAHCVQVAHQAGKILKRFGYSEHDIELVKIAGYMHDIGNVVNRVAHAQSGALMAFTLLTNMGMDPAEIAQVVSAIGNHDEGTAAAVNPIAAALILSDKGDVRRTRVRDKERVAIDIHDRVNYAVEQASLDIDPENKTAILDITIDTDICPVMDYFEIFLTRMVLCRSAAQYLGLSFELVINGVRLL